MHVLVNNIGSNLHYPSRSLRRLKRFLKSDGLGSFKALVSISTSISSLLQYNILTCNSSIFSLINLLLSRCITLNLLLSLLQDLLQFDCQSKWLFCHDECVDHLLVVYGESLLLMRQSIPHIRLLLYIVLRSMFSRHRGQQNHGPSPCRKPSPV